MEKFLSEHFLDLFFIWGFIIAILVDLIYRIIIFFCFKSKYFSSKSPKRNLGNIVVIPSRSDLLSYINIWLKEKDISITLHHMQLNWSFTLIIATVGFFLTSKISTWDSNNLLFFIIALFMLYGIIFRFFVRSILEYNYTCRWIYMIEVSNQLFNNYTNNMLKNRFKAAYNDFILCNCSFHGKQKLIKDNLRKGFIYVFLILILIIIYSLLKIHEYNTPLWIFFVSLIIGELEYISDSRRLNINHSNKHVNDFNKSRNTY